MTVVFLAFCLPLSAQQDAKWRAVEGLAPGELVELRDRATGVHTECVLAYATDAAVGCDTGGPYDPARRVVYPRAAIDAVWVIRWEHGPSVKAVLIGASIGGLVFGLAARGDTAGTVAAATGLGGLIGAACSNLGDTFHTRLSKRRHMVYRAN